MGCMQRQQRPPIHLALMMISQVNEIHDENEIIRLPQPTIILQIIQVIQVHVYRTAAAVTMMTHQVMTVHYHFFQII